MLNLSLLFFWLQNPKSANLRVSHSDVIVMWCDVMCNSAGMAPTNEELQHMGEIFGPDEERASASKVWVGQGEHAATGMQRPRRQNFPKRAHCGVVTVPWLRHLLSSLSPLMTSYDRTVYNIQHSCRFLKNSIPESTSAQEVEAKALLRRGCDSKMCWIPERGHQGGASLRGDGAELCPMKLWPGVAAVRSAPLTEHQGLDRPHDASRQSLLSWKAGDGSAKKSPARRMCCEICEWVEACRSQPREVVITCYHILSLVITCTGHASQEWHAEFISTCLNACDVPPGRREQEEAVGCFGQVGGRGISSHPHGPMELGPARPKGEVLIPKNR